jgi:hypothetical protein
MHLTCSNGPLERFLICMRNHQDRAGYCVLRDDCNQAVALHEIEL